MKRDTQSLPEIPEPDELEVAQTAAGSGKEVLGWRRFGQATRELASSVADSGFEPDFVIAIARGGMLLAGALAYALGVKGCGALNVEFYTDGPATLPDPVVLPPILDNDAVAGARVLLVDDVSDSGRTLAHVVELLETVGAEVRTACLYVKPRTICEPHYVWRATDRWIMFPWSTLPPVTKRTPA
ncbi:phosphoribosyltransferase [Homoserinimonas sp. OAct 916]|uniref:phosphoribosyltransferase n=1 Tax=Homoserinimonas sp. OAct 916 TaxID=2211450 RepID=UPI000DBE4001|nr:phosphoribosyltransferase family protein [Homoserinimonas sp. OAct 916]